MTDWCSGSACWSGRTSRPAGATADEFPNSKAREAAWKVFERFSLLDPLAVKAQFDTFDPLPYLRFDPSAQGLFLEWRAEFEARIRSGELPEALEGHLAKYRKLVPTLALLEPSRRRRGRADPP